MINVLISGFSQVGRILESQGLPIGNYTHQQVVKYTYGIDSSFIENRINWIKRS
jgi:hypothetical protein